MDFEPGFGVCVVCASRRQFDVVPNVFIILWVPKHFLILPRHNCEHERIVVAGRPTHNHFLSRTQLRVRSLERINTMKRFNRIEYVHTCTRKGKIYPHPCSSTQTTSKHPTLHGRLGPCCTACRSIYCLTHNLRVHGLAQAFALPERFVSASLHEGSATTEQPCVRPCAM